MENNRLQKKQNLSIWRQTAVLANIVKGMACTNAIIMEILLSLTLALDNAGNAPQQNTEWTDQPSVCQQA